MSFSTFDPYSFTKEQLKNELISHNAPVPNSKAKKDVFVDYFMKYIGNQTSEFSEEESETKTLKKKQESGTKVIDQVSIAVSTSTLVMDVYSLTDKELVDELKARGISTGPVMASTRRLYQKKLEKLIAAGDAIDGPEPEEEYSDEEEEEDSPPVTRSSSRSSSPRKRNASPKKTQSRSPARSPARSAGRSPARSPARSTRSSGRLRKREEEIERMSQDEDEVENEEDEIEDEGEDVIEMKPEARSQVTRRTVTSVEQSFTSTSRPAVQPSQFSSYKPKVPEVPQKKSGSKRLSILVQLGIFIIVATLIFVILQNL